MFMFIYILLLKCFFTFPGITQETIDETRLVREKKMLQDLKELHREKGNLEFRGRSGETPVWIFPQLCLNHLSTIVSFADEFSSSEKEFNIVNILQNVVRMTSIDEHGIDTVIMGMWEVQLHLQRGFAAFQYWMPFNLVLSGELIEDLFCFSLIQKFAGGRN